MLLQVHLRDAELKGERRGEARGERRKAIEMAKSFLQMGISPEVIARGSGLSLEEIEKLRREI